MKSVFSCGMGVQSTVILAAACDGLIPKPDHVVFSDPGAESQATYRHVAWCIDLSARHGITIDVVQSGNIYEDALTFGRRRVNVDVKRYASVPLFVRRGDGGDGMLPRQCTSEYKIYPIERYLRRQVLGLRPRQRVPPGEVVDVWIGISADEERRATPPGRWRTVKVLVGEDLFGGEVVKEQKRWVPVPWQQKTYPLLGYALRSDRSRVGRDEFGELAGWDRDDCRNYLRDRFPGYTVPRSACVFCPYRTNREWAAMKADEPAEFARAVQFDREIRAAYADGQHARGVLAGVPFVHRTLVPLDVVDLSEPLNDRMGCGGLFSEEPDGICGV